MVYGGSDRRYGRDRGYAQDRGGYGRGGYGRDEYRSERGYERGGYDRDRGGDRYGRGYDRDPGDYDYDDRGFFDRAGDEVRSWFGDEDAERRRRADERHYREQYERDRREWERSGGRSYPPMSSFGGIGAEGFGMMVPPVAMPYGYGGYGDERDRGRRADRPEADLNRGDPGYRYTEGRDRAFTGRERDREQEQHEQAYRSWRDRQMDAFDRDYDEYRREHQSKFDSDFATWRQTREGQRTHLRQAREHQEVVGSDGTHIGTVDQVRGDRILLTKADKDAGRHHHSIPVGWIQSVAEKVTINKTAEEAKRLWRDEEENMSSWQNERQGGRGSTTGAQGSEGPHALNRSFPGTY